MVKAVKQPKDFVAKDFQGKDTNQNDLIFQSGMCQLDETQFCG